MPQERSLEERLSAVERTVGSDISAGRAEGVSGTEVSETDTDSEDWGRDSDLPGRNSDIPGRDSDLPGRDSDIPDQDSDMTGRDSDDSDRDSDISSRVEELEATVAELEAGLQAIRGYVGTLDHVNQSVEQRANAAIAAVERLESAPKTPPSIATAEQSGEASHDRDGTSTDSTAGVDSSRSSPETGENSLLDRVTDLL